MTDDPQFDPSNYSPPVPDEAAAEVVTMSARVSETEEGERLDRFLAATVADFTRSRLKELIKAGHVRREANVILSPNARVKTGDVYELSLPPAAAPAPKPQDIPLVIAYEDDDLIVIDKPAGMVVHPATGHWHSTLVNALLFHCGDSLSGIGGVKRPGIVHRLDRQTSGLMVVAKNDRAHLGLSQQFADHGRQGPLTRAYTALVWGVIQPLKGKIDENIGRSNKNALKMAVLPEGGKFAITHYETVAQYGTVAQKRAPGLTGGPVPIASRVECRLETGRTHQIRVHLAHLGHPLIADPLYGSGFKTKVELLPEPVANAIGKFNRQALHAKQLGFEHPVSGEFLSFESELPADMQRIENLFKAL